MPPSKTTVVRMVDWDKKMSKAVGKLAEVLGTKTSVLVGLAVLEKYGPLLKSMGLFDLESVVSARQSDKE
jgi:hypothetical protein